MRYFFRLFAVSFFCLMLLPGCEKKNLIILNDVYTDHFMRTEMNPGFYCLRKTLFSGDTVFRYVLLENSGDTEALLSKIDNPGTCFILSPLVYLWTGGNGYNWKGSPLVFNFPGAWDDPEYPVIRIDRTKSFEEAGGLAGALVSRNGGYAVVYFFTGNDIRIKEKESFIKGFEERADTNYLLTHSFTDPSNHNIDTFQNAVGKSDIAVYGIFSSSVNDYVVNLVKSRNVPVIIEDGKSSGILENNAVCSIETDYRELFNAAAEYFTENFDSGSIVISSRFIVPKKLKKIQKGP